MSASAAKDPVILNAADVLEDLAANIEAIGAGLCRDIQVVSRHGGAMQGIDLQAQTARCLAQVLRSDCPRTALANVGVQDLQERLGRGAARA